MRLPLSAPDLWLRRFHPTTRAGARLVCLPHAGGSASYFFPVSRALSPTVDVVAIQYPGRQDRRSEPCLESVADLADGIAEAVRPLTGLPLSFFGHSLGATLAFEVARRLERDGLPVAGLFASGRRAPSRHRDERFHLCDDPGLLAEVRKLSGTAPQLLDDDEVIRMVLPAIRSDYRAAETYRYSPGPPLTCPVVALVGGDDPKVSREEAEAWADHTEGPFRLRVFPGGHFYLNTWVDEVVTEISRHLSPVPGGSPHRSGPGAA